MRIDDICTYALKSGIKAGDATKDGQYMFFTSGEDESKRYTDYQYDGEGIIMGTGGNATLHYYHGKYAVSTDCIVLNPDDRMRCKYLYYFFLANMPILEAGFKGAGLKHTNKKHIGGITISEIPPLDEQDRVIEILDKISEVINARKSEITALDDLIKARFVEMFGDPKLNPNDYPIHQLSKHIQFLTSGSRGWAEYCVDDGSEWFITIKNVKDCHITTDNMQPVNAPDNAEAKRTRVQEGDLLISITADLGRTGVVTKEIADHGAYINQHLTCIRLDRNALEPVYVAYFMESSAGKEQFISKNQSAVKAGLNFNSINTLRLIVPPLTVQQEFLRFVAQVDKSKVAVQKSLDKAQLLFDSLLQQFFG
ncbi:MAG: restriction endonuclease subunit S [Lachnospiraceae bacterium]|nr:restriction endonuclease subunit S [Lachnospiraceae bacterium]